MMRFLLLLPLLIPHLDGHFTNSPLVHLSDSLRVKCDALPYRTAFIGTRCYFAVNQEVKMDDATSKCNSIFPGSKIFTNAPNSVFNAMMLDKSRFHISKESSGKHEKQSICFYDNNYKCDNGELSSSFPGKCIAVSDKKSNYFDAVKYCDSLLMEVPAVSNERENRMVRGAVATNAAWVSHTYQGNTDKKWNRTTRFSKWSTCSPPWSFWEPKGLCPVTWRAGSIVDKTGYWWFSMEDKYTFDAVCVADATNEFNGGVKKCIANHAYDKKTGECEWTGPKDACAEIYSHYGEKMFVPMPLFPKRTILEYEMVEPYSDKVTKVVVRRGCMYTGYASHIHYRPRNDEIMKGNENRLYGVYRVPSYLTGDLPEFTDDINRLQCFCDPTEATINGHVPGSSQNKTCIEHHVFYEETKACEWIHETKYCGEITHNDGRKQKLEIPNWPTNKKYNAKEEKSFKTVTDILIRQHCWATLIRGTNVYDKKSLETAGYGKYAVASYHNFLTPSPDDGTERIICECMR